MKTHDPLPIVERRRFARASILIAAAFLSVSSLPAGETPPDKPAPVEEPTYNNWIELGIGGTIINGDEGQFKQAHGYFGDIYGGIQDLHYEKAIGKDTQFTIDGHAIFDANDYDVTVSLSKPDLGYIRAGYTEFTTWYDGNGGFFPPNGQWFEPANPDMALDRGEAWIELGLRMPKLPEITMRYSHLFRNGEKDSTIWGDTNQTGLTFNPARKIAPAFRNIDETRDIFMFELSKNIGNTDVALGMRYEHSDVDNRLQLERGAGQLPPAVNPPGAQRFITQNDKNSLDAFNGHVTTETRISDSLWFTTGYSYTTLNSDISGTRIIGTDYNSLYGDPILTLQSNDHGVLNLSGMSCADEQVANVNLMWVPIKHLTFLTGFRYTHENVDSTGSYLDTNTTANTAPFTPTNPQGGFHRAPVPTPRFSDSSNDFNNFAETFEIRYDGLNDWLFYARGDWEEEDGNVKEHEIVGTSDQGRLDKDTNLFVQKYTMGANWYPIAGLNFATQYFHRSADYDNDFLSELAAPPVPGSERNQRLLNQQLDADDVNLRITWRPKIPAKLGTLALVARYDYVNATIDGQWGISPALPPGTGGVGTTLASTQTAEIQNNIVTGTATWNPNARFYLQGTFSYVLNQTDTPADIVLIPNTAITVTNFHNDYWTASGSAGFVLDDKTDLHAEYTYYRADNFENNGYVGMPYGMSAREYTASASISRQLTKRVRLKLQYGYFHYVDVTSGFHNDYEAHTLFSSLQFRF